MRRFAFFILACSAAMTGRTQSPADWWYFGDKAGVHFTETGVVADTNSAILWWMGHSRASISDACGNLLFYTNGNVIYDSQHDTMLYGTDLMIASGYSTQACIIPAPGSDSRYYVFCLSAGSGWSAWTPGIRYTIVDMSLNGGLGAVDTAHKNILVGQEVFNQAMGITKHANGSDYWVVVGRHWLPDSVFCAYRLGPAGLDTVPVVSTFEHTFSHIGNGLKFNTRGDKVAFQMGNSNHVWMMRFDRQTGLFDEFVSIDISPHTPILLEFSPNDSLLYNAGQSSIVQMDISSWDSATISQSVVVIDSSAASYGGLQLGPDLKIYHGLHNHPYLNVIHYPNKQGTACNYEDSAAYLEGRVTALQLPWFFSGWFDTPRFAVQDLCAGDTLRVAMEYLGVYDSLRWDFGDTLSGAGNYSIQLAVAHVFSDTGSFNVTLTVYNCGTEKTITKPVKVYPHPVLDLGEDLRLCAGDQAAFDVRQPHASYLWHDGSDSAAFLTSGDTLVAVTVGNEACGAVSDTVFIRYDDTARVALGADTSLCVGASLTLGNAHAPAAQYRWNTGDTMPFLTVQKSGLYSLTAENTCGVFSDTVQVTFVPVFPNDLLPPDSVHCSEAPLVVSAPDLQGASFVWDDATASPQRLVDTTTRIWLVANSVCGQKADTMEVRFAAMPVVDLGGDTAICAGETVVMDVSLAGAAYVWNTGDTTGRMAALPHTATYTVTVTLDGCSTVATKEVRVDEGEDCDPCPVECPNVFTPNGDGINEQFTAKLVCTHEKFTLVIFNRWGQEVFRTTNPLMAWDGTIHGTPASEGVYYYTVTATIRNKERGINGSFSLLR